MIESALEWQLKLIEWQFFATLTWDSHKLHSRKVRIDQVNRWLAGYGSKCANISHVSDIPFVIRWERGELGGLPHCHLLLAGCPIAAVNLNTCFRNKNAWKRGVAQFRLYAPSRSAEAYMTKGKFSAYWLQGANAYELKKFNSQDVDMLYISSAAWLLMCAKRGADYSMLHCQT